MWQRLRDWMRDCVRSAMGTQGPCHVLVGAAVVKQTKNRTVFLVIPRICQCCSVAGGQMADPDRRTAGLETNPTCRSSSRPLVPPSTQVLKRPIRPSNGSVRISQ